MSLPTKKEFLAGLTDQNRSYIYGTLEKMALDGLGMNDADHIWDANMIEEQTPRIGILNEAL